MPSITSSNAVFMLSVSGIFPAPIQLQQFSADDIFTTGPLASAETSMGLDGVLSAGFVFVPITQTINLQANSPSNDLFDQWWQQQQINGDTFECNGIVVLPSLKKKWTLTRGFLTQFAPIPDAAKTLRPRRHGITWNRMSPGNIIA